MVADIRLRGRNRTNLIESRKMAVIYDNKVCVFANELISHDEKRNIGSEKGFMPLGTYNSKVRRGLIEVARRGGGQPALVYFDLLEEKVKQQYIAVYGDPHEEVERYKQGPLEQRIEYNEEAYTFFSSYRDENGKSLKPDKVMLYTMQARVLDAVIKLRANRSEMTIGAGSTRLNLWDRISALVNELQDIRMSNGEVKYLHKLPTSGKTLKRKLDQYEREGYAALVNKNHGNTAAKKVNTDEAEAVMHKLLSQHMNLNNAQIMEQYNKVAQVMGLTLIKSPVTVDAYRKSMESTTLGHRRGTAALRNRLEMQIKREKPTTALTYWTLDGWDVELVYSKQVVTTKKVNGEERKYKTTTYCNRKCMVVVLDACCNYPIGYAIGDHESPALIRAALRNAVNHTKELFGTRYRSKQLQSDNYQKKIMVPFYQGVTEIYTAAALGNAKSKIIEPYFNYLNKTYCQLQQNWSGVNINAKRDSQPNMEILNRNRHLIPDEEGVIQQINKIMAADRQKRLPELMECWERTPGERRLEFGDEEYLYLMGETTGRTNRLTGQGLMLEMLGERINFESFNMELRNHYNEDWIVKYDPEDMQQVLIVNAEATSGHRVKKEIGNLKFMLQRDIKIPMALCDQKPEHFEHRRKVAEFNQKFEQRYVAEQQKRDEVLMGALTRFPQLKSNNLLDRALIIDSRGQHKDRRSEAREEVTVQDAEVVEEWTPKPIPALPADDDDEDYDWAPTDMNFSR